MSPSASSADIALAADLVRAAATLAARIRDQGTDSLAVDTKSGISDVVTAADHAAERLITERLVAERTHDGLLGEEGTARESTSGRTWVIDPVDGTWNFVAGLPWWCSALALRGEGDDDVLLGAVHDPVRHRTFVGGPGIPTAVDGVALPPLADARLASSGVATYLHPSWQHGPVGDAWRRVADRVATVRMLGSGSMDVTAVAEGGLGMLFQHSVPPWDRLPGAGLVLGLGGAVRRVEAAGQVWHLAGAPSAVAEAADLLLDR
ncbi:inositol monophosphatase family protein [Nocardioides acrostichi]|uniref:Inositol monophosphatase n=1 Tax=Nocardioides acrostichi TaxID=2784339 RepID=A0A930UWL8_9ACTN|nr:inositol monophosphatase [Nocardioides acrostichi]MBF4162213.1 inositol monophosphatase [Nocardioides acrostichi]